MGIGVGIFLLALGAILTFAVNASISGVSIATIGIILIAAGALGILLDLLFFMPRRRVSQVDYVEPTTGTSRRVVHRDVV